MNRNTSACPLVLPVLLGLAGCGDTQARERLRQNAAATWESAVEVAVEAADEAQAGLERQLAELEPRIEELRRRSAHLQGQARAEAERLLADLEVERARLNEHVQRLKQQGAQAWERMVREAQGELDSLSRRLETALESQQ
jgi:TolA-binding protein